MRSKIESALTRSVGYSSSPRFATVNVKHYGPGTWDRIIARVSENQGGDRAHMPTFAAFVADCDLEAAWDRACSDGWDEAGNVAHEMFGAGYGVTSDGRSSGWLIVTYKGRPTFDEDTIQDWDAAEWRTWEDFQARIADLVADLPYQAMFGIYVNEYEPEADYRAEAFAIAGDNPFGLA